ncbi:hypothetical protein Dimus_034277 [Dionaea muscipula]
MIKIAQAAPSFARLPDWNLKSSAVNRGGGGGFSFHIRSRPCSYSSLPLRTSSCLNSHGGRPFRSAVLGAGFAGLSVVWYLLRHSSAELNLHIDIYDEAGIGGGASGVAGGLVHPYSPKVKLLWRGAECWSEFLNLLSFAEEAVKSHRSNNAEGAKCSQTTNNFIVRRRGILRPATREKNLAAMLGNAEDGLESCRIETIDRTAAQHLLPDVCVPLDVAFFMPEALNINPQLYLEALFLASQHLVGASEGGKSLCLHKKHVVSLSELAGYYDAVIVCLGARVDMLPELSGKLPLRACRGIVANLELPDGNGQYYPEASSPSILSDAWLAFQGPRSLHLGATWEWGSRNFSQHVLPGEASRSLEQLMPMASAVYPKITKSMFIGARAGLRAMPPLTAHGSLPLLGCIDDFVATESNSKYWLVGGLGSRGILYHGWLGKLTAQAVLSCNEDFIPPELTSWRNAKSR